MTLQKIVSGGQTGVDRGARCGDGGRTLSRAADVPGPARGRRVIADRYPLDSNGRRCSARRGA
ncbi:MAG: hypothetical protein ACREVE_13595 [Gammaproteobacteria bacterium]